VRREQALLWQLRANKSRLQLPADDAQHPDGVVSIDSEILRAANASISDVVRCDAI
jgi:hypothetical protein